MIYKLEDKSELLLQKILEVQIRAYAKESELINFEVPPLHETTTDLKSSPDLYFVYEINDNIKGVCSIEVKRQTVDITKLFVDPDSFNKGVASSLLSYIQSYSKLIGAKKIIVQTGILNTPAVSLYLKFGFNPESIINIEQSLFVIRFQKQILF